MKKNLFDSLKDETPVPVGKEIGAALSSAMAEMNKSNEAMTSSMALMITKAMAKAFESPKEVVIQKDKVIRKWIFRVVRDKDNLMTDIIAEAHTD